MQYFNSEFHARMSRLVNEFITPKPRPSADLFRDMNLSPSDALVFQFMITLGLFPRIKTKRGRGGGMYLETPPTVEATTA